MKHLELIFKNDDIVMYHTKDFSLVTDKLIAAVEWPKSVNTLSFDFKPFSPVGGVVKHKVKGDYGVRYMYGGKASTLKPAGKEMKNSVIVARAPKNLKETVAVTKATLCKKAKAEADMQGLGYKKELRMYMSLLKKTKNVLLLKDGRYVGIASLFDRPRLDGKKCSTFTWLWIDERLPKAERNDALYKATKWAKENCLEYMGSANHAYNHESQKIDSAMGLKPYRIFFARKAK
jgi:hypothetical protein